MGQDGYGKVGAYNTIEDDGSSLAENIVQYSKRATQDEGKVRELESRVAALEMGPPPTQPQTGFCAPQMAYEMMPGGTPPHLPQSRICQHTNSNNNKVTAGSGATNEYNRGGQRRRPKKYQGGGRGGGYRGDRRNDNNTQKA